MKRLSILLTLALMGQSVFAGLNVPGWTDSITELKSELLATDEASFRVLYTRVLELEKELKQINPNDDAATLQHAYNLLMPILTGMPIETKFTTGNKVECKAALLILISKKKSDIQTAINTFSRFGKMINATKFGVCHPIETAKIAGNGLAYGASASLNFVNNHKLATAGTVATAATLGAAAYNREALKNLASKVAACAQENAPVAKAYAATKFAELCDSRLALAAKWNFYKGANAVIENPKAAAGISTASVAGALATVKAYKAYKAYKTAKLNAEKEAIRKALNLSPDVI